MTIDIFDPSGDADLVAYLDNELAPARRAEIEHRLSADPKMRDRLTFLSHGGGPALQGAFDVLLQAAPDRDLKDFLDALPGRVGNRSRRFEWRHAWPQLIAASLVALVAGVAIGWGIPKLAYPPPAVVADSEDWRQAVAEYFPLYSPDTLGFMSASADVQNSELAMAGDRLGLKLTPDAVAATNLDFKGAQVFDFQGKALVQLAYLDSRHGPVALCILAEGSQAVPVTLEHRGTLNDVSWNTDKHGYMLIGRTPTAELESMARQFQNRLGG